MQLVPLWYKYDDWNKLCLTLRIKNFKYLYNEFINFMYV